MTNKFKIYNKDLRRVYEQIAINSKFYSQNVEIEDLPEEGKPRWGLSIVVRGNVPTQLFQSISRLKKLLGNNHTFYNDSNFHFTVRTVDVYKQDLSESSSQINKIVEILEGFNFSEDQFIKINGLIPTSRSIISCGFPNFDMMSIRLDLHSELMKNGLILGSPETDIKKLRNTCHGSICLFGSPLKYSALVENFLSESHIYGYVKDLKIDLVSYLRTRNDVTLISHKF